MYYIFWPPIHVELWKGQPSHFHPHRCCCVFFGIPDTNYNNTTQRSYSTQWSMNNSFSGKGSVCPCAPLVRLCTWCHLATRQQTRLQLSGITSLAFGAPFCLHVYIDWSKAGSMRATRETREWITYSQWLIWVRARRKKTNKTSEKRRNKCEGGRGETLLVFSCFYFLKRCISIRLLMW